MIRVSKLSYEYPGLRALDEVSFEIAQGSITALLGPNGAGKTTLNRCIAGMDRPLSGSIHVNGVDVVADGDACVRAYDVADDGFVVVADDCAGVCAYDALPTVLATVLVAVLTTVLMTVRSEELATI